MKEPRWIINYWNQIPKEWRKKRLLRDLQYAISQLPWYLKNASFKVWWIVFFT